jgi:hypothetical protein
VKTLTSVAGFFFFVTCVYGAEGPSKQSSTSLAAGSSEATAQEGHIFLIEDQTGEELVQVHGIRPVSTADMEVLINAVLKNGKPAQLLHQAVDEDATDNVVAQLEFRPYAGGHPPKAPSTSLPLLQLAEEMKAYRKSRAAWQQGLLAYRNQVVGEVEAFVRQLIATQLAVAERFDRMLAARNGRDFSRSDIVGSIVAANRLLGTAGQRVLVLNTDAEDLPGKRKQRTTPLTAVELNPEIELVFVNTSRIPDASILFQGLQNPKHHANTMQEAMQFVATTLGTNHGEEDEK